MAATPASFAELLRTAVSEPGTISTAYSEFHNYSLGNQLLALGQCLARVSSQDRSQRSHVGRSWADTSLKVSTL